MSQTFDIPMAGSVTLASSRGILNDGLDTLRSTFSGAVAPTSPTPVSGQIYFNTGDNTFYAYNGTGWVAVMGPLSVSDGGTLLADGSVPMTGDLDMGSNRIKGLTGGTAATEAATKGQVDSRRLVTATKIGDISASEDSYIMAIGVAHTVAAVTVSTTASLASTGSDFWTIQVRDLTAAVDLKASAYDTNSDGDLTSDARNDIGLDQNLAVASGNLLEIQFGKNGSIGNLTDVVVFLEYTVEV